MKRGLMLLALISLVGSHVLGIDACLATEEFANRTGKVCSFCHEDPNGGPLNTVGIAYVRNGYEYPIPESVLTKSANLSSRLHRLIRLILGYLHLAAACILAGTIFYVHIFIKPSSITGGIPRGERLLGITCLFVPSLTGIYLTWYRIDSFSSFFMSSFGVLLFIKLIPFIIMLVSAIIAVTVVHNRMKRPRPIPAVRNADFSIDDLPAYDGKEDRPAYVLFNNIVYDVTNSPKWNDGNHFRKHLAGRDLTAQIDGAPHTDEVFSDIPIIAELSDHRPR